MKVRQDDKGLYIQSRMGKEDVSGRYRPGGVIGYDHVYEMGDGGLKEGDNPKTHHVAGAPLVKITLDDGRVLHWMSDAERFMRSGGAL